MLRNIQDIWYAFRYRVWAPAWYCVRSHTYRRYHYLDIRSPANDYKYGWVDADHKLLLASMAILVDFIEKEKPFDVWDWSAPVRVDAQKEILHLYHYWKVQRPYELKVIERLYSGISRYDIVTERPTAEDRKTYDIISRLEDNLQESDTVALQRLAAVRGWMWT